jgi:hypothetical protein
MPRLSTKQSNLIYHNARYLDLSPDDERALNRLSYVDMDRADIMTLIDAVWGFIRGKTEGERWGWGNEIKSVIEHYKEQTKAIE